MKQSTAIVTGAAGALGSDLSLCLIERGWSVVMLDKDRRGLEQAYDRIGDQAGTGLLHPMDLAGATPDDFADLLQTTEAECGGLDAVVHCAAHFESLAPSEHIQPQDWLMSMQVNLNAAWLLSAMALPLLRNSENGKLVFLLEDLDKVRGALWGAYGVSKHALATLVNQLSLECRSSGIDVRGVDPGPMRSPVRTRAYHAENPAHMPSLQFPALRIADFLENKSKWEGVLVDLAAAS
jgi:NAD(P)-dependent dehydrogenase (short-subunit alcohol dehydrogenase family)